MKRSRALSWLAIGAVVTLWGLPAHAEPVGDAARDAPEAPAPTAPQEIAVRGVRPESPRGVGDFRIRRELLTASPRQQTSELLSAAPGFFVDHEDGEGFGNDVYLRGFDLEHGSGIEMHVGAVPLNIPTHIQGQGYVDANLIIPEVVSQVRVLEGPYDPRQGDAAIVGSAYFDLGVAERGASLRASYGSFNQKRLLGIWAPHDADADTFVAVSLRDSDGFGQNRASRSAALNAQYGFDWGAQNHVRVLAIARGARADLPGVVRQDDVDAGRIGFYDSYAHYAENQSVSATTLLLGAELRHVSTSGALFSVAPWLMWSDFRARQNYTGTLQSSRMDPSKFALGDLFETSNLETAAGVTAFARSAPQRLGEIAEVGVEPGVYLRVGHTNQAKSLLVPDDLAVWDRRLDAGLRTLDAGAYLDLDFLLWKGLRVSGGPRVDVLSVSIADQIANGARAAFGVSVGPRVTAQYSIAKPLALVASYGEGFRSLDTTRLKDGATPYSKVRSVEVGVRAQLPNERFTSTLALYQTRIGNELVFVATNGGLESENASVRRGIVASMVARPVRWLLASGSLSVNDANFDTLVAGVSHHVPSIPPLLFRADVSARGSLGKVAGHGLSGRVGVGYTYAARRHLNDTVRGPQTNALNLGAEVRTSSIALGVDVYNALGLQYADSSDIYVSNWSPKPGQQPASLAIHSAAAPPTSVLGSVSLFF